MADAGADRLAVLVLNAISASGLSRLPPEIYRVGKDITEPDAILVRSADLHAMAIPAGVRAIGRAGAGTNNIPIPPLSARGVPVFNTPGANANAVKELVLAGMLIAARQIAPALRYVSALDVTAADLDAVVENGKKAFGGYELQGQTLGIVGLGKIGCLVAEAAIKLGMTVLGFDPEITVDAAWSLPSQVRRAASVNEVLRGAQFVSLHVPLVEATRHLVNDGNVGLMRPGAVLLNFSRDGVVSNAAVLDALAAERLSAYVCDFPSAELHGHPRVVALPHLGASTREAEENCAVMVVDQLRDYLEHGQITNAVNFPAVQMARESAWRVAIANSNVPNMLGQISTAMARAGLNIHNMVNKSRGEMAYTLVDVEAPVAPAVLDELRAIHGVLAVRYLPQR
ncbi:D-3-phosphoglycerate dehydrogenase [Rubrivivax sp. A210]|uniref:phosphoglycerate dehydrogenase n=1 Tax=Rubrivivax sp. A210 TaxID=2772301 RepID=UPI00191A5DE8|nr:phosphoglycerate dehydrogenase [Rubrivivax sp. A210]CAD5372440.1 D-3-phosphoglycerate dehydrogenase [Rubrivivax sp. A210]